LKTCSWILILLAVVSLGTAVCAGDYDQARSAAEELSRAGNKTGAADLLEAAIGTHTDADAEWLRGYIGLLRNAPASEVMNQFLKVADTFPGSNRAADALLRASYLRDKLGDDARQDWERLVTSYPGTREAAEGLHQLGHCALRHGDVELAISRFEQSAALSEVDVDVAEDSRMELGFAYISQYWKTLDAGCLGRAAKALEPVTRPANTQRAIRAHIGRGEVFLRLGLPDPAWAEYKAVLRLESAEPYYRRIALFELACCEYQNERWAQSAAAFDTFLADVPGTTLTEKDAQWKQARPDYARLLTVNPERANALCGLELVPEAACWKGKALLKAGRVSDAKAIADDLTTRFPDMRLGYEVRALQAACNAAIGEGE